MIRNGVTPSSLAGESFDSLRMLSEVEAGRDGGIDGGEKLPMATPTSILPRQGGGGKDCASTENWKMWVMDCPEGEG